MLDHKCQHENDSDNIFGADCVRMLSVSTQVGCMRIQSVFREFMRASKAQGYQFLSTYQAQC